MRNAAIAGIVSLIVLAILSRWFARLVTDGWWFEALGQRAVLSKISRTRIELGLVFGLVAATLLYGCLLIVHRTPPIDPLFGPEDQLVARYQVMVAERGLAVRMGTAGVFGFFAALPVSSRWQDWLLMRNAVSFRQFDAVYHKDFGYYVFTLPFLSFLVEWVFTVVLVATLLTVAAHYLSGTIRLSGPRRAVSTVRVQLSVLVVVLALLRAVAYWLHRYELVWSTRGVVRGLSYTDEHHVRPALLLLVLVAVTTAALVVVGLRQRSWRLPMVAAASWAVVALMAGTVFPAVVQRVVDHDDPALRERAVISRNLHATRFGMGVDGTRLQTEGLAADDLVVEDADLSALADVRVVAPEVARAAVAQGGTAGGDKGENVVSVEPSRYIVDGRAEQVYLAVPTIDPGPKANWKSRHELDVSAPPPTVVNASFVRSDGQPIPTSSERGKLPVTGGRIYLSVDTSAYAVVPKGEPPDATSVSLSSFPKRLAFALRFGDLAVLQQTGGTDRVLYVRQVVDRVRKLAPFLTVDDDAYPVVADNRLVWVVDAYTTSDNFPASQRADVSGLDDESALKYSYNYVRNSVKAVVDAHNGTVTLYAMDQNDPMLTAWATAFPTLFTDAAKMPAEVREHLRYPLDLLRVQTAMWGRYRTDDKRPDDPTQFTGRSGSWVAAPVDASPSGVQPTEALASTTTTAGSSSTTASSGQTSTTTAASSGSSRAPQPVPPTYALWGSSMAAVQPMVDAQRPAAKEDLASLVVATVDPSGQPRLRVYRADGRIASPATARAKLNAAVDEQPEPYRFTGELQAVRVGDTIAWVLPWYAASRQGTNALGGVAMLADGNVVTARSVEAAATKLFGVDPGFRTVEPGGEEAEVPAPVDGEDTYESLLAQAEAARDLAHKSELNGDLAKAVEYLDTAVEYATRAARLAAEQAGPTTTTTSPVNA